MGPPPCLEQLLRVPSTVLVDADDAGRLLLRNDATGTLQLYELSGGDLRQLTGFAEPATGRYLPGSRRLVVAADTGGNERHQLSLLDAVTGELAPLVHDPRFIHRIAGVSLDGRLVAYLCNRRNGVDFDLYVHDLSSGEDRCVYDGGGWCQPQGFSPDGRWLTLYRPGPWPMDGDLLLVDAAGGGAVVLTPHAEPAEVTAPAWLPDGSGFYFSTSQGADVLRVARYDLREERWEHVLDGPWDTSCAVSRDGATLLVGANEEGCTRLSLYRAGDLAPLGEVPLAGPGVAWWEDLVPPPQLAPDASWLAYTLSGPQQPPAVFRFDRATGATARVAGEPADGALALPELGRVPSFDGETVPVLVYRPPVTGRGPTPVVVHVHGGPESQARPTFNPVVQGLVSRGYAAVVPNVRGSTGYGKRYYSLDDTVRRLDSVADLAAVHDWMASAGLDPGRAALWGGSYGGYMVLAGVSMQPERWAAGVDIVGISDLVTFLERTSAYRRAHREREYGSLERDREFLRAASPLTHVGEIRAPLFVIHGANDPRVPLSEAEQIAASLASRGVRHELVVYADEGHGLARLANRLDAYPRAADFLREVLGAA
ncbi:MAG: S9 family peptidase [Acidimicrobiales bacterium]